MRWRSLRIVCTSSARAAGDRTGAPVLPAGRHTLVSAVDLDRSGGLSGADSGRRRSIPVTAGAWVGEGAPQTATARPGAARLSLG